MPSAAVWRRQIQNVIAGSGLRLAVQPIVDIAQGATVGFEVLSRFSGPPDASPDVWFKRAESLGLGAALDAAVIRQALDLRPDLPTGCFLSINIDPSHLDDERVRQAFADAGNLRQVVVELTEHSIIADYPSTIGHLQLLRDANAKIAIDDAGSGYAGLQWLMLLSPDIVKLDRALVDRMDGDEVKLALVAMLGTFADRIDAWLLAEGMERQAELDAAVRLGIPLGQGYLLARPSLERWPRLVPTVQPALPGPGSSKPAGTLARLVESAETRHVALSNEPVRNVTVVVDIDRQPLCIDLPNRSGLPVLCVRADETLAAALARAMTRHPDHRWSPLVCVDERRRVTGIVRLERMVEAMMAQACVHDAAGLDPQP